MRKNNYFRTVKQAYIVIMIICLCGCAPTTYLRQSTFSKGSVQANEKIDCIVNFTSFYQTKDYTIYRCDTDLNNFFFVPSSLLVEKDLFENPLVFQQYLNKKTINAIIKFTFDRVKFIEATSYLKSVDTNYNLAVMPINSVCISNSTTIPDKNIYYFGTTTYAYFDGYITFEVHGKKQINEMRNLLIKDNGFQMIYQFNFLTKNNGQVIQTKSQIPIYIRNINL